MKVGYVRESTIEQNEAVQLKKMEEHGVEKVFIEKKSGSNMERPALLDMLDYIREGDEVNVYELSRLARSTKDLLTIVESIESKRASLNCFKESIDTSTASGKLMLTMLAAIYQFERENMLERQREGIAIAKAEGKYKGRKSKEIEGGIGEHYRRYMAREISKPALAKELGISRPTLDRMFREYEASIKN